MKKDITTIVEETRMAFGITRDEYSLCAYVQFRIADPRNTKPGWCTDSKEEIAEFVGITRPGLYKMVDRMEGAGLLETFGRCSAIRVTEKWMDANTGCKLSLQNRVSLKKSERKLSLQKTVNKVTHINKVKDDIGRNNSVDSNEPTAGVYTFDDFWHEYAYKVGSKARAHEQFRKLKPAAMALIQKTLPLYLRETVTKDTARNKAEFKPMRLHPERYLSRKIWETYKDRIEAIEAEESNPTPYDENYKIYLDWVKKNYPHVIGETKHMSKSQFIAFKTEYYVQGKSWMGEKMELRYLQDAHRKLETDPDARNTYSDVFSLHCEYVKQHVKAHTV